MLSPDDIHHQRELLAAHRRTLAHLLKQAAAYGGVALTPPQTANGIDHARTGIAICKALLRDSGVAVGDMPGDEEEDQIAPSPAKRAPARLTRGQIERREQRRGQLTESILRVRGHLAKLRREWEVQDGLAKMRLAQQIEDMQAILDGDEQELEQIESDLGC